MFNDLVNNDFLTVYSNLPSTITVITLLVASGPRSGRRAFQTKHGSIMYSAFANSCPLQTDTFLFPLIHSHNLKFSSNKF